MRFASLHWQSRMRSDFNDMVMIGQVLAPSMAQSENKDMCYRQRG